MRSAVHGQAAGDADHLARDEAGVVAAEEGDGAGQVIRLAQAAEAAGFDQFWLSNDLFLRSAPTLLAALAVHTERIELGSCIFNPYTIHPAELAMLAATMDELSGNRLAEPTQYQRHNEELRSHGRRSEVRKPLKSLIHRPKHAARVQTFFASAGRG